MDGALKNPESLSKIKLHLFLNKSADSFFSGSYRSIFRGSGLDFDEVRQYTDGEDSRLIDWNVSSRMKEPYKKVYKEERELVLFLIIDFSASVFSGENKMTKKDQIALSAALLSLGAAGSDDRVGAVFFTDKIEKFIHPGKGKKHALGIIKNILTFSPDNKGSDLGLAIRTARKSLKCRGTCVILSDFRTRGFWKDLSLLKKRHDVIAVKITDSQDYTFPGRSLVRVSDPETGGFLYARGGSEKFRREYSEFWDMEHFSWIRSCRKAGISTLTMATEDDVYKKFLSFFNRRRRR